MSIALIVLLPFLGAVLPALMIRSGRNESAIATCSITMLSLALLLTNVAAIARGEILQSSWVWVPQIGLNAHFRVDGLGLLFAGMILGIGLLITIYARFYLGPDEALGRFYAYLLLFQGAMVGVVLSENTLFMMVFWELTSLSSFLLIGFKSDAQEGRQGARMALAITAGGGLALLAGILLLGQVAGSFELSEILAKGDQVRSSPQYLLILILVLVGCFTKSAQFPFHFWLPHAMAAPTPVSAYLHSATMVKAGVFLMLRLWPVLSGTEAWFYIVTTTGLVTMLMAAVIALFKEDLKSILAYSTISQLGMMTLLVGLNTDMAVVACVFHVLNHAAFKAALFMNAGIIQHETGTRNIQRLGGLMGLMPISCTLATLACAAMAGIPPMNGFLSKEMMLEEVSHARWLGTVWLLPSIVTIAAIFSVAYSVRSLFFIYGGPVREDYPLTPHDPSRGLWLPPACLIVLAVLTGLFPESWAGDVVRWASAAALQTDLPKFHLSIWHGWTPALAMSIIAVLAGSFLLLLYNPLRYQWNAVPKPSGKELYDRSLAFLVQSMRSCNETIYNGSLPRILFVLLLTSTVLGGWTFFKSNYAAGGRELLPVNGVVVVGWILVIAACYIVVRQHRSRLVALLTVNIVGLVSAGAFVLLSAPDLALTQIAVEVVTLILMLLALHFLPKETLLETSAWRQYRDVSLAIASGSGVGYLSWAMMTHDFQSISNYYIQHSKPLGGGANVVNVILVDFRGFDTFGEIMVIGIAAISIFSMLDGMHSGAVFVSLSQWKSGLRFAPNRHPIMMVVVTRIMLPLAILVGCFIFLRGHNLPGGGFIAALVVSIALIMQYMASGFHWADERVHFDYHALIGGGALITAASGIGSMVLGKPFLTSGFRYVDFPFIGKVELASATAFDLGVFLTVVGGVMLALANFSNLGRMTAEGQQSDSD